MILDKFTIQYIETALWATSDIDDDGHEFNFQDKFCIDDIFSDSLKAMKEDCEEFQKQAKGFIEKNPSLAGHDFWLTRNGHGAGFWDGDWDNGDILTEICKKFPECYLYVGDDGKVYCG